MMIKIRNVDADKSRKELIMKRKTKIIIGVLIAIIVILIIILCVSGSTSSVQGFLNKYGG